jgi:hypothetical protein
MNATRDKEKERKCGTRKLKLVAKKARCSQKSGGKKARKVCK